MLRAGVGVSFRIAHDAGLVPERLDDYVNNFHVTSAPSTWILAGETAMIWSFGSSRPMHNQS